MENPDYLYKQVIYYKGNKRALLSFIAEGLGLARKRLGKDRLVLLDAMSGSGVVARFFKRYASKVIANDLESYADALNKCYLANASEVDLVAVQAACDLLNEKKSELQPQGFIAKLYAPADDTNVQPGERAFYTNRNATLFDNIRRLLDTEVEEEIRPFVLGPLLFQASYRANAGGHFAGFYKNPKTGVGMFGGKNQEKLFRIKGDVVAEPPVLSNYECEWESHQRDINKLLPELEEVDVAYIDPPYSNSVPYGAHYFMLNLVTDYEEPKKLSKVSGFPSDWKRSDYYSKVRSENAIESLIRDVKAKIVLLSYSDEGFLSAEQLEKLLSKYGTVNKLSSSHAAYRGGIRHLKKKTTKLTEFLYVVEKY